MQNIYQAFPCRTSYVLKFFKKSKHRDKIAFLTDIVWQLTPIDIKWTAENMLVKNQLDLFKI